MSGAYGNKARAPRSRLMRHLLIALLVKIVLLAALWHVFIRPNRLAVDAESMGGRIVGAPPQIHREKGHD